MINLKDIPTGVLPLMVRSEELGAAVDCDRAIFYADKSYKILAAGYVPDAAMTGATATCRTLAFWDKGTDGSTGAAAIKTGVSFVLGVDLVAYDYKELISASDAKTITTGHVVSFKATHTGGGTALPAGTIVMLLWPISE